MRIARPLVYVVCWLGMLTTASCVYDHRFTQAMMEQRRRAAAAKGARIAPSPGVSRPVRYTGRVRFYVADEYRQQHTRWREPLEDLVDAASSVLGPTFATRLESTELRPWSPRCDRDQLEACLDELAKLDPGEDGTWVVGVIGDTPRFTTSFEQLGVARLVSSHIVLRDVADLAEREAIDRAFPTHTPSQREEIYRHRKQHRRLAVFLHEWGHTLGALHTEQRDELLYPSYDDRMASFGDANTGLITASLEDRFGHEGGQKLLAHVEHTEASRFVAHDHERLLALLRAQVAAKDAPASSNPATAAMVGSAAPKPDASDPALVALAPADRASHRAAESAAEEDPQAAWRMLSPLVTRYPSVEPVQRLACTLSMRVGDVAAAQASCPRVQQLAAKSSR